MRNRMVILAASALLVVGASLVAVAQTDETPEDGSGNSRPHQALSSVLDDLVADDVITEDQAQAITEALGEKWQEVKAEHMEKREQRQEQLEVIRGFLEDDVISAEELAQLPEDSVLRNTEGPFAEALEDGEISRDELKEFGAFLRGFRRGHRHGALFGAGSVDSTG